MTSTIAKKKTALNRQGMKGIGQELFANFLMLSILLISAGTFFWVNAWLYVGLKIFLLIIYTATLLKINPDLLNARGKYVKKDTKTFDKIFFAIGRPLIFMIMIIAGLDIVRYQWSSMPFGISIVGVVFFLTAFLLMLWGLAVNANYETSIRIQNDRDHQVCDWGPYRIVRHPGYVGLIVEFLSTPVVLGSWWALIPGSALAFLVVVRTAKEDRMLHDELQGYEQYAKRVGYRLMPGIW